MDRRAVFFLIAAAVCAALVGCGSKAEEPLDPAPGDLGSGLEPGKEGGLLGLRRARVRLAVPEKVEDAAFVVGVQRPAL